MVATYPELRTPHKGGEGSLTITLPPPNSSTPGQVVNMCVQTHEWTENRASQEATTTCDFDPVKKIVYTDKVETERGITWSASGFIYSEINAYTTFEPAVIGPVVLVNYAPDIPSGAAGLQCTMPRAGLESFKVGMNQVTGLQTWEASGYSKGKYYITPAVPPASMMVGFDPANEYRADMPVNAPLAKIAPEAPDATVSANVPLPGVTTSPAPPTGSVPATGSIPPR
jgi:hypothetical protein